MHAEQRQRRTVERARGGGRVDVAALAAELGVTAGTVRRTMPESARRVARRLEPAGPRVVGA